MPETTHKPEQSDSNSQSVWRTFVYVVLTLTIIAFWYNFYSRNFSAGFGADNLEEKLSDEYSYGECNVAGVVLHGDLDTYVVSVAEGEGMDDVVSSEDIVYQIESAEDEPDIKAILLEIDSYGGYPVAAEEIATALKNATKPAVVQIRGAGLSAAYWAATGADTIFASELSDVGSIGVTQSYVDASKYNEVSGYTYNSLRTSKYKDVLNPEKPLTAEERALLMRDLQITHDAFVKTVAENRGMDINKVRALADGSSMLGKMALENGLIDRVGGFDEVEKYLEELIGAKSEICW